MEEPISNQLPRVRLVRTWRLEGAKAFADALNVTTQQLYYVLNGKRRSPRIESALAEQNISCRVRRRKGAVK